MSSITNPPIELASFDQAGPSGVISISQTRMIKVESAKQNANEIVEKSEISQQENQPEPGNQEEEAEGKGKNENQAMLIFAERVTIAGLEEAYKAKYTADKIMFRSALVLAFIMIVFEACTIVRQYRDRNTFLDSSPISGVTAPFPNVSICFPISINETLFLLHAIVPERIKDIMAKHNISMRQVMDYIKIMYSMRLNSTSASTVIHLVTERIFDATSESMLKQNRNIWQLLIPECSQVLFNCSFNGRPFDCCEAAQFMTFWIMSCFHISLSTSSMSLDASGYDPMRLEATGLVVEVSTDWTYGIFEDGSASDGYHVFVDKLPSPVGVPVPIPSGMDALITLAPATKVSEITRCRSNNPIPRLTHFDYYDPHGIQCEAQGLLDMVYDILGANMGFLSYWPKNESATFSQDFLLTLGFTDGSAHLLQKSQSDMLGKKHNTFRKLHSADSPCAPLCSRWTYDIFSSSYASIKYRDRLEQERQSINRSWSRIRVISPQSLTWWRKEQRLAVTYLTICDIGGIMGVYAGFSMITFAQIVGYGFYVLWSKRNRRKVACAVVAPTETSDKLQ